MKYSIITINYNNATGLEQTIKSIIDQTCNNLQFIIIDGGSTDGSVDVIKQNAKHIDYWVSEPDGGRYPAMNKGIRQATGNYLNFMNSGDTFHSPSVLEDIAMMNLNEDIITGGFYDKEKDEKHIIVPQDVTLLTILKNTFNHQATFFKRDLFDSRLYDENYVIQSDAKFNIESIIFDNCSVKIIDYIIADYDFNGISSRKELVLNERKRMLEELFPPRVLKDYEYMYTPAEMPIISIFPELKQSPTILRWVCRISTFLLKCKYLIK